MTHTLCLASLLIMLAATSKWLKLADQDAKAKQSLAFKVQHKVRGHAPGLEAHLDGILLLHEFRQLGFG